MKKGHTGLSTKPITLWIDGEEMKSVAFASRRSGISYAYLVKAVRESIAGQHGDIIIKGHLVSRTVPTAERLEKYRKQVGEFKPLRIVDDAAPMKKGEVLVRRPMESVQTATPTALRIATEKIDKLEARIEYLEKEKIIRIEKNHLQLHNKYQLLKETVESMKLALADRGIEVDG